MNPVHIPDFDLNLLKVFGAVMETRSASRAATLLGVSQSAVSHALARLRDQVGEPLFVRTAAGMEPTPRALRLADPLRDALDAAARALAAAERFDPARDAHNFTVAASDAVQAVLFPAVLAAAAVAPRVSLRLRSLHADAALDALDAGEIELAVGFLPRVRRWHERRALYAETHACLFNPALVPASVPITLADYARHPHVVPSLRGELTSFVDEALEAEGLARRAVAGTAQFLAIPALLRRAPLIATLPARLAHCCAAPDLVASPLPVASPGYEVAMAWHRRDTAPPAHAWLREQVAAAATG